MTNQTVYTRRDLNRASRAVHDEFSSIYSRPDLVEYLVICVALARALSEEMLHGKHGWEYAANICSAIAWQGAPDSSGHQWLTVDTEPELYRAFELASELNEDNSDERKWDELFRVVDQLSEQM